MPSTCNPATAHRGRRAVLHLISALTLGLSSLVSLHANAQELSLVPAFGPVSGECELKVVIAAYEGGLVTVLALGMQPVGSGGGPGGKSLPAFVEGRAGNFPIVGV